MKGLPLLCLLIGLLASPALRADAQGLAHLDALRKDQERLHKEHLQQMHQTQKAMAAFAAKVWGTPSPKQADKPVPAPVQKKLVVPDIQP